MSHKIRVSREAHLGGALRTLFGEERADVSVSSAGTVVQKRSAGVGAASVEVLGQQHLQLKPRRSAVIMQAPGDA